LWKVLDRFNTTFFHYLLLHFHAQVSFEDPADATRPVEMDYSRAGLGIFSPKDTEMKVRLTRLL
jgi:hypothetical protein